MVAAAVLFDAHNALGTVLGVGQDVVRSLAVVYTLDLVSHRPIVH